MKKDKTAFANSISYRNGYRDGETDGIEKSSIVMFIVMIIVIAISIGLLEHYVQGNWKKFEEKYYTQEECYERINI